MIHGAKPRRRDCQDARFAGYHYVAHIRRRAADQVDNTTGMRFGFVPYPLGAGARLAPIAAGEDKPNPPRKSRRRQLLGPCPKPPIIL